MTEFTVENGRVIFDCELPSQHQNIIELGKGPFVIIMIEFENENLIIKATKGLGFSDSIKYMTNVVSKNTLIVVVFGAMYLINFSQPSSARLVSSSVSFAQERHGKFIVVDRWSVFFVGEEGIVWEQKNIMVDGAEKIWMEESKVNLIGDSKKMEKEFFSFDIKSGIRNL